MNALPAHPRSRGEHAIILPISSNTAGSSPLARGTHTGARAGSTPLRLIPARAGNTMTDITLKLTEAAHPRSRGEHKSAPRPIRELVGSSPLARGTLSWRVCPVDGLRLIPARAGNTPIGAQSFDLKTAHPRSRGEHQPRPCMITAAGGSSPLARGTRAPCPRSDCRRRLIPARAGNTERPPRAKCSCTAHPRSRGEHFTVISRPVLERGSSPLARGTPKPERTFGLDSRLIPARAGNTCYHHLPPSSSTAHPRSRGEHLAHLFRG